MTEKKKIVDSKKTGELKNKTKKQQQTDKNRTERACIICVPACCWLWA